MHWLLAHFIGDYLIQNDWMQKKKQSSFHCIVHVVTYMLPFSVCGLLWWQIAAIFFQHYMQDRTNFVVWFMRIKGSKKFTEPPFAPWSIFLIDNIIHILWIAAIVKFGEFV